MKYSKLVPALRILLFAIGGFSYGLIELLWRGRTHWSMLLLGGLCFGLIGHIGERGKSHGILWRCSLCAVAVTVCEFICGCVVNLWWGLRVWDYSAQPLHLFGQVCPLFALLWGLLSIPVMPLYRRIRDRLQQPTYLLHVSKTPLRSPLPQES